MHIATLEVLTADAGWRTHDFVKLTMRDGLVGWSEFSRAFGDGGVVDAVTHIAPLLIGRDPRAEDTGALLAEVGQQSPAAYQACGALQNALLDVHARALGVSVYQMLGNRLRDRVRLYWAHCGTYRASHAAAMGKPPLADLTDVVRLGQEVKERGYTALKTNLLVFGNRRARRYRAADEELNKLSPRELGTALCEQLAAFRQGAGADVELMVDFGSNFDADQALAVIASCQSDNPLWLEIELPEPQALRSIRQRSGLPVAGGERLQANEYDEILRADALDIPIVDVLCNGLLGSLRIASVCASYGKSIAVHNCYSPLATMIAATFCALATDLYLLEHDVDAVPWEQEFVTHPPAIDGGYLSIPDGPGWGTEVNEATVRAHPLERHL